MSGAASANDSLVSVVIPTFNRPAYLRIALASATAQTYRNLEIIVCDNASPDDPSAIVAAFADPRIRLHRHASNLGPTPNTVRGVQMAIGKYVAILGDDDVWQPDFIATLVAPMEADAEIVVAFCDHDIIDSDGAVSPATTDRVTRRFGRHLLRDGVYRDFGDIALVYRSICVVSGSVIRRAAIDWSGIPEDLPISVDLYIAYLLAISGAAAWFTASHLMQYRYHTISTARRFTNFDRSWRADLHWTLDLWTVFLRDDRMTSRSYFRMICARKAALIVVERLRHGDWRGLRSDLTQFLRTGLLDPRAIYDHFAYFLRFQRQRMGRLIP